jgi:hypothetical protein
VTHSGAGAQLRDVNVDIKLKLSALWASVTLCYLYCDYFELYQAGKLQSMLAGQLEPLGPASQGVLLGVSVLLSLPALMIPCPSRCRPRLAALRICCSESSSRSSC